MPLVGGLMKDMLLGGDTYSAATVPRLYVLHAAVLPGAMVALLGLHVMFIRLHGIAELKPEDDSSEESDESASHFNFFPDHVFTELIIGITLMIVLSALATIEPAGLGPPADPLTTPEVIKPEWFFFATFRWLKIVPLSFAVLSMGLIVFIWILWPWIDAALCRWTRRDDVGFWIGGVCALSIILMTVWEALVQH